MKFITNIFCFSALFISTLASAQEAATIPGAKLLNDASAHCQQKIIPSLAKQMTWIDSIAGQNLCSCLNVGLKTQFDANKTYARSAFNARASEIFSGCLTPVLRKQYQQSCVSNLEEFRQLQQQLPSLTKKSYGYYCNCMSETTVNVQTQTNGIKPLDPAQAKQMCLQRMSVK